MSVPSFNESTRAEKLPMEVFRWLKEASMYLRANPTNAEEVYDVLKLVLRLLAVRNPDSQSHATREALGSLIEGIYSSPNSDKIILDLLALLIRMVEAKQNHRFNPMKHLAISGLGYLSRHLRINMRQMSANVFIIALDSFKICPQSSEADSYRNTLLWTLTQAATEALDEASLKRAIKIAKARIEHSDCDEDGDETRARAFRLLTRLVPLPVAKCMEKKLDTLHGLFYHHGITSSDVRVRIAASEFYAAALVALRPHDFSQHLTEAISTTIKLQNSKSYGHDATVRYKRDGHLRLLGSLLNYNGRLENFENQFEEWLAPLILTLPPVTAKALLVNGVLRQRLESAQNGVDVVAVLLRQLALSRAPPSKKTSLQKSKQSQLMTPTTESTLACLAETITILGSSIQPSAMSIHQATLGLILNGADPLTDEQLGWCIVCLEAVVRASPMLLLPTLQLCLKQLEIPQNPRSLESSYVVGAMLRQSAVLPLYNDMTINSQVVLLGFDLIKRRTDLVSYKVGWVLLSGSLCLRSELVKSIVPHLLLLWETHLSNDAGTLPEFAECALSGLAIFLTHHQSLLTPDVIGRLSEVLYLVWSSIESKPTNPGIKKRLLQCYDQLLLVDRLEKLPSSLLMKFAAHISVTHNYSKEIGVPIESAMVLSSKIKQQAPNSSAVPVPHLILEKYDAIDAGLAGVCDDDRASMSNDLDFVIFLHSPFNLEDTWINGLPRDRYTAVVDLAISVTSRLLPFQPVRIQESVFDAILSNVESCTIPLTLRKIAVMYNIATFINVTLPRLGTFEGRVLDFLTTIIKNLLGNELETIRKLAAMSCGTLSVKRNESNVGAALPSLVKDLLESSISQSSSVQLRHGSLLALGYVTQNRSEATLLDAAFKVYMQSAGDSDPLVHTVAISAMRRSLMTPDALDLKYARYTLKSVALTYLFETHSNRQAFQREAAESLVQVLSRIGPLLSTEQQQKNRELIICFADQFQNNDDPLVRVLAWKCFIEIYYYARHEITWPFIIRRWRDVIIQRSGSDAEIDAAINGLLVLMKLSAKSLIMIIGPGFNDALWLLLDKRPRDGELRKLFEEWLSQTIQDDSSISLWIKSLSTVIMKPRYFFMDRLNGSMKKHESLHTNGEKMASVMPTAVAADEDVALEVQTDETNNEQLSWEARRFALDLLLQLVISDLRGKSEALKVNSITSKLAADLIRIAFLASTSQILGLQYGGLALLNELVVQLSDLKDPEFPQVSYLAQYQVQIVSALSTAFGADSSPGLALAALRTCSTFISSDIVGSKEKLAKLTKILEDSLVSMESGEFRIGGLRPTVDASRVLRVSVLAVWASMANFGKRKEYLRELIVPHEDLLKRYWSEAIYEFGRINSALDSQWSKASLNLAVEQMEELETKLLVKPIYDASWLSFVQALSNIGDLDVDFRLVLCGMCFKALLDVLQSAHGGNPTGQLDHNQDTESASFATINRMSSLHAVVADATYADEWGTHMGRTSILGVLREILTPAISQQLMSDKDGYFEEILPILYRAMLTGNSEDQLAILKIAHALVEGQPETDDSVDHFFGVLKIAIMPLRRMFPSLFDRGEESKLTAPNPLSENQLSLLRSTMDTVIDIAQVFREVIQNDLWVCLLKVFEEINHFEPLVIAPSFKRLLEILAAQVESRGVTFLVGALTVSLRRAVSRPSINESLLLSAAITCTNYRSLYTPTALYEVQRFGNKAADALISGVAKDATSGDRQLAITAMQCISAVLSVSSDSPTGVSFAHACLPALIHVLASEELAASKSSPELYRQCAITISQYAASDGTVETLALVVPSLVATKDYAFGPLLLQILTQNPAIFKHVVWQLDEDDRKLLQNMLSHKAQESPESSSISDEESDIEESIPLKSFD